MNAAQRLLQRVSSQGTPVRQDGEMHRESMGVRLGVRGIPIISRRQLNPMLGVLLGLGLVTGVGVRDLIEEWRTSRMDEGLVWADEETQTVGRQLQVVENTLRVTRASSNAVLHLSGYAGIQCVQFTGRENELFMQVVISRWDLVRQLPQDLVAWGVVAQVLANSLRVANLRIYYCPLQALVQEADAAVISGMLQEREAIKGIQLTYMRDIDGYFTLLQDIRRQLTAAPVAEWLAIMHSIAYEEAVS